MKDINRIQILGDFKAVIDWANKKIEIENIRLGHLLQEIQSSLQTFQWIEFGHVYHELNQKANELSKEALTRKVGTFCFSEFMDEGEVDTMDFHYWRNTL